MAKWTEGKIQRQNLKSLDTSGLVFFTRLTNDVTLLHNKIRKPAKQRENVQGIFWVSLLFMFSQAKCEIDFFMFSHLKGHLARNHRIFNHANPYFLSQTSQHQILL
jgi:hypothetical protein